MSAWTLEEAKTNLELWKAALQAVSTGQAYTISGRSLTRANISDIMDMIKYFGAEVERQENNASGLGPRRKVRRYIPLDL